MANLSHSRIYITIISLLLTSSTVTAPDEDLIAAIKVGNVDQVNAMLHPYGGGREWIDEKDGVSWHGMEWWEIGWDA